jgi:hypothetical protein
MRRRDLLVAEKELPLPQEMGNYFTWGGTEPVAL